MMDEKQSREIEQGQGLQDDRYSFEGGKSPPLLSSLYHTGRAVSAALDAALAPINLSSAQWGILRMVDEQPGIAGAQIARNAEVSAAAVTTMLGRLEAGGLIERRAQPYGRIIETHLTAYGRERLQAGDAIVARLEQHLCSLLQKRCLIQLLAEMERLTHALYNCSQDEL